MRDVSLSIWTGVAPLVISNRRAAAVMAALNLAISACSDDPSPPKGATEASSETTPGAGGATGPGSEDLVPTLSSGGATDPGGSQTSTPPATGASVPTASPMGGSPSVADPLETASGGTPSGEAGAPPSVGFGGASAMAGGASPGGDAGSGAAGTPQELQPSGGATGEPPDPDPSCGTHKWACWPMPNPAGSGLPNEASYTDSGDGTVMDDVTGLLWERDPPGDTFDWQAALDYCEGLNLGGFDDWRLPTRIEMTSIMDYSQGGAKFDPEAFPGARGGFHKTSSDWILTIDQRGAGANTDFAWAFNMSDGIVSNAYSKATAARLRCVRASGTGEGPSEAAVPPPAQYSVVAEGEVQDNYTGLIWQAGYSESSSSFEAAVSYCEGLALGGQSWRLPSVRELATLVDEAEVAPAINREMFPDTQYGSRSNNWYWASHRPPNDANVAWALNFDDGFTGFNAGSSGDWNYWTEAWAKCVR